MDVWAGWLADGRTNRQKERHTDRQRTQRQTGGQTGMQTLECHTHTFGQTDRQSKNTVTDTRVRMRTLGHARSCMYGK